MKSGFCLPLIQFHSSCPCYPSQFLHICEPLSKPSIPLLCPTDPQHSTLISGLLTSSSASALSHFTSKLCPISNNPSFLPHLLTWAVWLARWQQWPMLWFCQGAAKMVSSSDSGSDSPCLSNRKHRKYSNFSQLNQCWSSFKNPLTTHWCGIQKRATEFDGFIQIQPPTQSLVRGHWLKYLLCFSVHFFYYTNGHWY